MPNPSSVKQETVRVLLEENRIFPPSDEFKRNALIRDESIYQEAAKNREAFWAKWAGELDWFRKWDKVLDWQLPFAKWFVGGKINASANCLDRHVRTARRNKAAIIFEGEPGDRRVLRPQARGSRQGDRQCERPQQANGRQGPNVEGSASPRIAQMDHHSLLNWKAYSFARFSLK